MSAICGIFNPSGDIDKTALDNIAKPLKHRGNRGSCKYVDKKIALLTIPFKTKTDFSEVAFNERRDIIAILDGYLLNYEELIKCLDKADIESFADLIVILYEKFGLEFVKKLDGDFAFAIWDSRNEKLILGKDISNNKQIYYSKIEGNFIFASEIKGLFKFQGIKKTIDLGSVSNFLNFGHISFPYTLFDGIRRVKPSSIMVIQKNKIYEKEFWDINFNLKLPWSEERIIDLLENSTRKRLNISDNWGLFLSGGLDSTTLLYFLDKLSADTVNTFTIGIGEDGKYGRMASEFFGTKHTDFFPSSSDIIKISPKALWFYEFPLWHVGSFMYYLTKISRNINFAFWGQGSEEIFFGRRDYVIVKKLQVLNKNTPKFMKNLFNKLIVKLPHSKLYTLSRIAFSNDSYNQYVSFREVLTDIEKNNLLSDQISSIDPLKRIKKFNNKLSKDPVKNYSYLTLRNGFLSDTFMNISQELLNPYFDKKVIEYCYAIPTEIKLKNSIFRYVLKKIMSDKLPASLLNRKPETWPMKPWFKEQKNIMYDVIDRLKKRKIIKENIYKAINPNSSHYDRKIWSLFNLEILCEVFLDNDPKNPKI
ncbi:MAG: hypothetical protein J4428_02810 [Candidatus Aenigmarchaeota archaeon]|nr:hypothetical protein [Candidatus Aenigmarchaeota archaeon]